MQGQGNWGSLLKTALEMSHQTLKSTQASNYNKRVDQGTVFQLIMMVTVQVRSFALVDSLEIYILLGTIYIDYWNKRVFTMNRKIVPIHSTQIRIFSRGRDLFKISSILSKMASSFGIGDHESCDNSSREQLTVPSERESPVIVITSRDVLITIEHIQPASWQIKCYF